jgi:adenylate kinase family enzyme
MNRIHVCGNSGSGKTTLARAISKELGLPHVELDMIYHLPGWQQMPKDQFRERISEVASTEEWVIDGNYGSVRDIVWERADTVVWLDYPLPLVLWRLWRRTWGRWWRREIVCNGNRESLWTHFFTKESLFWWVLTTSRRRSRLYLEAMESPEHADKHFIKLTSPDKAEQWLSALTPEASPCAGNSARLLS